MAWGYNYICPICGAGTDKLPYADPHPNAKPQHRCRPHILRRIDAEFGPEPEEEPDYDDRLADGFLATDLGT